MWAQALLYCVTLSLMANRDISDQTWFRVPNYLKRYGCLYWEAVGVFVFRGHLRRIWKHFHFNLFSSAYKCSTLNNQQSLNVRLVCQSWIIYVDMLKRPIHQPDLMCLSVNKGGGTEMKNDVFGCTSKVSYLSVCS